VRALILHGFFLFRAKGADCVKSMTQYVDHLSSGLDEGMKKRNKAENEN
jgi:hypothetical protein